MRSKQPHWSRSFLLVNIPLEDDVSFPSHTCKEGILGYGPILGERVCLRTTSYSAKLATQKNYIWEAPKLAIWWRVVVPLCIPGIAPCKLRMLNIVHSV